MCDTRAANAPMKARGVRGGEVMKPKLRVWLVFLDRVKIGAGRAELLEAIEELGSIEAAAEREYARLFRSHREGSSTADNGRGGKQRGAPAGLHSQPWQAIHP
jgi:hypothetical protein